MESPSLRTDVLEDPEGGLVPAASLCSMNVVIPTAMLARYVGYQRAFAALGVPDDVDSLCDEARKYQHTQFIVSLKTIVTDAREAQKMLDRHIARLTETSVNGERITAAQHVTTGCTNELWVDGVRLIDDNVHRLMLLHRLCTWSQTVPSPTLLSPVQFYEHLQGPWTAALNVAAAELAALLAAAQAECQVHQEAA